MRRHAEVAHHAVEGARNALLAARNAARETLAVAAALTIEASDAQAIREAARSHLRQVELALAALEPALRTGEAVNQAVDRAEISRLGVPVLQIRAGA